MAPGEDVAFEPAFEGVLAQHLHDAALGGEVTAVGVLGQGCGHPGLAVAALVDYLQLVRGCLIRSEDAEGGHVVLHDVAQEVREGVGGGEQGGPGLLDLDRIPCKVRHLERAAEFAPVGMGICRDAAVSLWGHLFEFREQRAVLVEELLRPIAAQPSFNQLQVRRFGGGIENRHLVGAPRSFKLVAVDLFGAGPAFRRAQDDHGPAWTLDGGPCGSGTRRGLNGANLHDTFFHRGCHLRVHDRGVIAFDDDGLPAVALEETLQLLGRDAGEDGGIGDLVAVEVEDGEDGSVVDGVEELVGVPGGGHGACFGLSIAYDDGDDEIRIVECGTESVGEAVSELASLVDRPWSLRSAVASDAAGEGELLEELLQASSILTLIRVDLRVDAFEVAVREGRRSTVAGSGDIDEVEIVFPDEPVEVDPDKGLPGIRAPVSKKAMLDVLCLEGLFEQRVFQQVEHADAEVVAGPPVGIDLAVFFGRENFRGGKVGGSQDTNLVLCPVSAPV